MIRWIPIIAYVLVSSTVLVEIDNRYDLDPTLVLVVTTIQIAIGGFFLPDSPYRRAPR